MKEAKSPKKPLIFYYGVVLAVLLAFNMIVSPLLLERQVTEVDYGTFMRMIDDKDIGEVQMDDSEILLCRIARWCSACTRRAPSSPARWKKPCPPC